jgi:CheY-like chemotaxis protein/anti-sigma regulatory factor (Ser/Thr protein kinase)
MEPVDLHSIIAQALESVDPLVKQKKHLLTVSSTPGELYVNGDSARLIQCVTNLLTNAVKYTAEGGEIRVEARGALANATISVSDNGIGIPEDLMPRIFGLFVQSARTLDRSEGGLGIGLSVVERLMQMHGGSVEASSSGPGTGSTFELRLPRIDAAAMSVPKPEPLIRVSKRILVVDDNVDAANSIADLLRLDDNDVSVVHSAGTALKKFSTFRPDVVLLDIGLPDMDGYQVAKWIRGVNRSVRIVALTGYGRPEDLLRAKESGFDDHLTKPVDFQSLSRVISAGGG